MSDLRRHHRLNSLASRLQSYSCPPQQHLDNRQRKVKAFVDRDTSTPTKVELQAIKHYNHSTAKGPFTTTELGEREAP
jgi:hypothetical protein